MTAQVCVRAANRPDPHVFSSNGHRDGTDPRHQRSRIERPATPSSDGCYEIRLHLGREVTASWAGLLALNGGVLEAAMGMLLAVRGLRPWRAGRELVEVVPKPARWMVSSWAGALAMVENTARAVASASALGGEVGLVHPGSPPEPVGPGISHCWKSS